MRTSHLTKAVAPLITAVALVAQTATAAFVWDGGGADGSWADDNNWEGGTAPTATTTDTIEINETQTISTSVLDQDRTIGGVYFQGTDTNHIFDLGGHTLTVAGKWGYSNDGGQGMITNGTLRFGNDTTAGSIDIKSGNGPQPWIDFMAEGGGQFDTYNLGTVEMGGWGSRDNRLDLRNATIVGGTFEAENLVFDHEGTLYLPDSPAITKLYIRHRADLSQRDHGYHGTDALAIRLPANVDMQVGQSAASPGEILVGDDSGGNSHGRIEALGTGGEFTAYLDVFLLGRGSQNNSMDLSLMDSVTIDASTADGEIGTGDSGDGTVKLPVGTATFGSLTIGQDSDGTGLLELAGTEVDVLTDMEIKATGTVDLTDGAILRVARVSHGGSLTIGGNPCAEGGWYDSSTHPDYITGSGSIWFIPEPTTFALLGLGGAVMVSRRRRR